MSKYTFSVQGTDVGPFVSSLFQLVTNSHIAHLQSRTYSTHKALNKLYDNLPDLIDRFVESYQGKYGIIKDYSNFSISNNLDMIQVLQGKLSELEEFKISITDGYLQQIIDEIIELISSTLYKLNYLN